jgi:hypothetical protein
MAASNFSSGILATACVVLYWRSLSPALSAACIRAAQQCGADQVLMPGEYPSGMRVYADGEWEAIVRSRPLGKLERTSLGAYFEADG